MNKTPLMKFLGMASWLVTGLYSFNELLKRFGVDFMTLDFMKHPSLANAVSWLVGLAGLASLAMFAMMASCRGGSCCGDKCSGKGGQQQGGYCSRCGSAPCRCPK